MGDVDEANLVPRFDEVDNVFSTNRGRVALANRVLAKPKDEENGSAREILLFELARDFSFDDEQPLQFGLDGASDTAGPYEALLRLSPGDLLNLEARVEYNTLDARIDSSSISGRLSQGPTFFDLTLYSRPVRGNRADLGHQLQVGGGIDVLPRRLRLEARVLYDDELGELQQQRYVLNWADQCYGLRVEALDFGAEDIRARRDNEFRFSLSLKNVGTFLDLTGRSDPSE